MNENMLHICFVAILRVSLCKSCAVVFKQLTEDTNNLSSAFILQFFKFFFTSKMIVYKQWKLKYWSVGSCQSDVQIRACFTQTKKEWLIV